jgi:predicted negative regulator of RcsB-dependent stress response
MAIDDLLDEHEQSERVRSWLRQNAAGLIGGVALGLGAIYGWFWWKDQGETKRMQGSDTYQAMLDKLATGDIKGAQAKATDLKDSDYATLVALDLAKAQVDGGKRDDAIATLRAVKPAEPALAAVVNQRLARLLIDAGKGEEALTLLKDLDDPIALEVRGDALYALGRKDQARDAYSKALGRLDEAAPHRPLLELKLTQAGGTPQKPQTSDSTS